MATERQGRADTVRQQRRRRGDSEFRADKRLNIPPEVEERLKAQGLVPRWVHDVGNRMQRFTERDDYDKVEGVDPVPVDTDQNGKPILAHLLAKRADFIQEDRDAAEAKRREREKALVRGKVEDGGAGVNAPPSGPSEFYVAKGTEIGRGNQILE